MSDSFARGRGAVTEAGREQTVRLTLAERNHWISRAQNSREIPAVGGTTPQIETIQRCEKETK